MEFNLFLESEAYSSLTIRIISIIKFIDNGHWLSEKYFITYQYFLIISSFETSFQDPVKSLRSIETKIIFFREKLQNNRHL